MRLLCDEGVERQIPARRRAVGHTVWYVAEMEPGIADAQVLSLCRQHEAALITGDKDFGEMVSRRGEAHHGMFLMRMSGASPETKAQILVDFIAQHGERVPGAFSVLEPGRWRVRTATR